MSLSKSRIKEVEEAYYCMTEIVPKDVYVPPEYGYNTWGYVSASQLWMGTYTVSLKSANNVYGKVNDAVSIILVGDFDMSSTISLIDSMGAGSEYRTKLDLPLVGNIMMLKIKVGSASKFMCDYISITLTYKMWYFPCQEPYDNSSKDGFTLLPSGNAPYVLMIYTEKGSADPIYVGFIGQDGSTNWHLLSAKGFPQGYHTRTVYGNFVGELIAVKFKKIPLVDKPWGFANAIILNNNKSYNLASTQVTDMIYVYIGAKKPKVIEKKDEYKRNFISDVGEVEMLAANTYFNGNCLRQVDQRLVFDATCMTTFEDVQDRFGNFEAIKPGEFPNHKNLYVRCPAFCSIGGTSGLYIHPIGTSLCISAKADGLIDHTGGVIQVSVAPGQSVYNLEFPEMNGINIFKAAPGKISYTVSKVDGPMFVKPSVRIINGDGHIDTEGRLEVRVDRIWQTVKIHIDSDGPNGAGLKNDLVARAACQYLGYEFGINKGPDSKMQQVTNEVGQVMLVCARSKNFDCRTNLNDQLNHGLDMTVKCLDKNPETGEVPDGYYELEKPYDSAKTTPVVYFSNKRYYFCFDSLSKVVKEYATNFCQKSGYEDGAEFLVYQGKDNFPGKTKEAGKIFGVIVETKCKIKDLEYKFDINCLKIEPSYNDCTIAYARCMGFPGASSAKAGIKPIFRLFPPQMFKKPIGCSTTLQDVITDYSGDPGSKYTFNCPSGCSKGGVTQGIGLYSVSSSICKAAVQMGVVSDSVGGYVSVTIGAFAVKLDKGTNNIGITSNALPVNDGDEIVPQITFTVDEPTTCDGLEIIGAFIQTRSYTYKRSFLQSKIKSKLTASASSQSLQTSSISSQGKMEKYFCLYWNCTAPVYFYTPAPEELINLDQYTVMDLTPTPNFENTRSMNYNSFTILLGITIDKFPEVEYSTVFAHSEASGYAFIINNLQTHDKNPIFEFIKIGAGGEEYRFVSNYIPSLGTYYNIAITYNFANGTGRVKFYIKDGNKPYSQVIKKKFQEFTLGGRLVLGNIGEGQDKYLVGTVYYFVLFNTVLEEKVLGPFMESTKMVVSIPTGGTTPLGAITNDARTCIRYPKHGPVPDRIWNDKYTASVDPKAKYSNTPESKANKDSKTQMKNDDKKKEKKKDEKEKKDEKDETKKKDEKDSDSSNESKSDPAVVEDVAFPEADSPIKCQLTGSDLFPNLDNEPLTAPQDFSKTLKVVICPKNCIRDNLVLNVYGPSAGKTPTDLFIYTVSSSLCGAAIHAGIIKNEDGGVIKVHLTWGVNAYLSKDFNGIKSTELGTTDQAVYIMEHGTIHDIDDDINLYDLMDMYHGTDVYYVRCPAQTFSSVKNKKVSVIGSKFVGYAASSHICYAAMHAELLNNESAAELTLRVVDKLTLYYCRDLPDVSCDNNGILASEGYNKLGFKFEYSKNSCQFFTEIQDKPIDIKYYTSNDVLWNYVKNAPEAIIAFPRVNKASYIVNKSFDCGNCKFSFTLNINRIPKVDNEYIGVIFRYNNVALTETYYALRMKPRRLELIKAGGITEDVLTYVEYEFRNVKKELGIWIYNFIVVYDLGSIKVYMNVEPKAEWKLMINIINYDFKRGKVGFTTSGTYDAKVSNISTGRAVFKKEETTYDINPFVNSIKFSHDEKVHTCNKRFAYAPSAIGMCMTTMGWCDLNCKDVDYNFARYQCIEHCILKHQIYDLMKQQNPGAIVSACPSKLYGVDLTTYMKVDYKPTKNCDGSINLENYQKGWIYKYTPKGDNCFFTIQYVCKDGDTSAYEIVEEDTTELNRLSLCGMHIKERLIKKQGEQTNSCQKSYVKGQSLKDV